MIHRIKSIKVLPDYKLLVAFDDGKTVIYDVKEDMRDIPGYEILRTSYGLFQQVQIDKSRTCVYWSPDVDLPSDAIYDYGEDLEVQADLCPASEIDWGPDVGGEGNIEMITYNTHEETEAFMDGYVWGHRKGRLSGYEKCLKMLNDSPEELRAMLMSEISRLCQEIEDNNKNK